jgi:hypothetical protein
VFSLHRHLPPLKGFPSYSHSAKVLGQEVRYRSIQPCIILTNLPGWT